mmetsp:Transcript_32728/g.92254  ORF Transcript_32728/g.92254 Transcript_32728/m.92254 type:complete len:155 (-) Transcript_32728:1185-1649(-)
MACGNRQVAAVEGDLCKFALPGLERPRCIVDRCSAVERRQLFSMSHALDTHGTTPPRGDQRTAKQAMFQGSYHRRGCCSRCRHLHGVAASPILPNMAGHRINCVSDGSVAVGGSDLGLDVVSPIFLGLHCKHLNIACGWGFNLMADYLDDFSLT